LKWIRERPEFKSILVAILTSSQADGDISATTRLGGDFYLVKPATKQKLTELVKNLAENWA
jgi:CheY-like chemotaxis protein